MEEQTRERLLEIQRRVKRMRFEAECGCIFSWVSATEDVAFLWDLLVQAKQRIKELEGKLGVPPKNLVDAPISAYAASR